MSKYYNKEISTEIHFVYGGRYLGKNHYSFNKIKKENERLKEELELEKSISSNLARNILKAIEYINDNGIIDLNGYDLLKILKGEE